MDIETDNLHEKCRLYSKCVLSTFIPQLICTIVYINKLMNENVMMLLITSKRLLRLSRFYCCNRHIYIKKMYLPILQRMLYSFTSRLTC